MAMRTVRYFPTPQREDDGIYPAHQSADTGGPAVHHAGDVQPQRGSDYGFR
jgi:hypothetical protein